MKILKNIFKNRFDRTFAKIEGQISRDEIFYLYELAKGIKEGTAILEIGSFRGKSTIALGFGSLAGNNNKVYSIDPHENFTGVAGGVFGPQDLKQKYTNIVKSGLGELIFCISLKSEQVAKIWEKEIGLLWIDGDHSYETVKNDFESFSHWLVSGGYLVFHDSEMQGVKKTIDQIIISRFDYKIITRFESTIVFQKE